jgi:hypothetical protein
MSLGGKSFLAQILQLCPSYEGGIGREPGHGAYSKTLLVKQDPISCVADKETKVQVSKRTDLIGKRFSGAKKKSLNALGV